METPAGFLQRGLRELTDSSYSKQQLDCTMQQASPAQQSDDEVAGAEPTNANAAIINNRYFMRISC